MSGPNIVVIIKHFSAISQTVAYLYLFNGIQYQKSS